MTAIILLIWIFQYNSKYVHSQNKLWDMPDQLKEGFVYIDLHCQYPPGSDYEGLFSSY